jgi:hypothetical protein
MRSTRMCASEMYPIFTLPTSKADKEAGVLSAIALKYCKQIAVKRFFESKIAQERKPEVSSFLQKAFDWGNTYEPHARRATAEYLSTPIYEHTCIVDDLGSGGYLMFSPDGWYRYPDNVLSVVEFKCPYSTEVFEQTLFYETVEDVRAHETHKHYVIQAELNAWAIGATHCCLVFYDPRLHDHGCGLSVIKWVPDLSKIEALIDNAYAEVRRLMSKPFRKKHYLYTPAPQLF